MRGSQSKMRVPPLPAPGGRLVLRAHNALARSRLSWWCDTRPVLGLINPLMEMSAADVLTVCATVASTTTQWWITGGWGVDALLGRQTRRHRDLDLLVGDDPAVVEGVSSALGGLGLGFLSERSVPESFAPRRVCLADASGHGVDLLPVNLAASPFIATEGEEAPFTSGHIGGRLVPCVATTLHHRARDVPYRRRPSDTHDMRMLVEADASESTGAGSTT